MARYWVGGTDTWDATAGSKWALTSGGAGGQAVPTANDDVFFDATSGSVTVTIATATALCNNLDFTGFTGTLAGSTSLTISGSLTLGSAMTFSNTGLKTFNGGIPRTITTNGVSIGGNFQVDGTNTLTILDALTLTNGGITLNTSTLIANSNVTINSLNSSNSGVRGLQMGPGTWTLRGTTSNPWTTTTTTNLTFDAGSSTIKLTSPLTTNRTFGGGGLTFNNFWNATTNDFTITIAGSNTFNNFRVDPGRTQRFTAGTTQTVASFTATGTSSNLVTINSTTSTNFNLVKSGGGISSNDYLLITDSTASPLGSWYAQQNSVDGGGNEGWLFSAYIFVQKPTDAIYTNVNAPGREQYDDSLVLYDDGDTFYDGADPSSYTNIAKPTGTPYTSVAKPTN